MESTSDAIACYLRAYLLTRPTEGLCMIQRISILVWTGNIHCRPNLVIRDDDRRDLTFEKQTLYYKSISKGGMPSNL